MSRNKTTYREIIDQLIRENLVSPGDLQKFREMVEPPRGRRTLQGFSTFGTFVALAFLIVGLLVMELLNTPLRFGVLGVILISIGLASRPLVDKQDRIPITISVIGQLLMIGVLFNEFIEMDMIPAACLGVIMMEVLLLFLSRDTLQSPISIFVSILAFLLLVYNLKNPYLTQFTVITVGLALVFWWEKEESIFPYCPYTYHNAGLGLAALLLLILLISPFEADFMKDRSWFLATIGLAGTLGLLLHFILRNYHPPAKITAPLYAGVAVLAVTTSWSPGITASLLVMVLAYREGETELFEIALAGLAFYLFMYYYSLNTTLMVKSLYLMVTGAILLVIRHTVKPLIHISSLRTPAEGGDEPATPWAAKKYYPLLVLATAIALMVPNYLIHQKENLVKQGQTVLLPLAPKDPRTLIQGDYMRLRYSLARRVQALGISKLPRRGKVVIVLDKNNIGRFKRIYKGGEIVPNEQLLQYHIARGKVHFGSEAFLFQEGHQKIYETARHGELKVDKSGKSVLVGLRDENLRALGKNER